MFFTFTVIVTEKTNILLRYLHQQCDKKVSSLEEDQVVVRNLQPYAHKMSTNITFSKTHYVGVLVGEFCVWEEQSCLTLLVLFYRMLPRKGNRSKERGGAQHPPGKLPEQIAKR